MNICFLAYMPMVPFHGGVQRVTTIISRELTRRGHNVVFLSYDEGLKSFITSSSIEFPQYYLDITSKDNNAISREFHRFLDSHSIDCIICQEQEGYSTELIQMVKGEKRVIAVYHTAPFAILKATRKTLWHYLPSSNLKLICYKAIALFCPFLYINHIIEKTKKNIYKTLQYSEALVFISKRFFPQLLLQMPDFPKNKLVAINNPSTFDSELPDDYKSKRRLVLWVGRVDPNKNCLDFLKAWRRFSLYHPEWSAIVAGDGSELQRCIHYSNKHKLGNISFLGYCDDVLALYREAKIFVSTSLSESWGMSLIEAMSMECVPCVYNTYETLNDIVQDGETGLLCDPKPKALVSRLETLIADEVELHKMAKIGRESTARFSVASICNQWEELLHNDIRE